MHDHSPPPTAGSRTPLETRRWSAARVAELAESLGAEGAAALAALPAGRRLRAWLGTVAELRRRDSPARRRLEAVMLPGTGLSPEGLAAGLETILEGVDSPFAEEIFQAAPAEPPRPGFALIVLAATPPGLAAQPLLPALALGRPVLLKSSRAEPFFAPALVDALCRREPRLRPALAAGTWAGGERELEAPLLARARKVLAYGGGEVMADLEARAGEKLVAYGPKLSLAVVGSDVEPAEVAAGLVRDVALFDQRGCLSIQAVYAAGDAEALAESLATALAERARRWPQGRLEPRTLAAIQQLRAEAEMRGRSLAQPSIEAGTVILSDAPELRPSPGGRTVRVHPLADLQRLPEHLEPWRGQLQGAALAGAEALALGPILTHLGLSRLAPPGELQRPDATWANGAVPPLAALA